MVELGGVGSKMVECEYTVLNINIFNVEYHAIIEIVESGHVD